MKQRTHCLALLLIATLASLSKPNLAQVITRLQLTGCTQSTTSYQWGAAECQRAIDGNTNQAWGSNSCTHTLEDSGPWWAATTTGFAQFREVRIFNREDDNKERFKNFAILVDGQQCASYRSDIAFTVKNFTCNAVGRELKLVNPGDKYLTFCEIQAFGSILFTNQLQLTGCTQSSTNTEWGNAECKRAIDNNINQSWGSNSCTHTKEETEPWWAATTTGLAQFREVKIFNREDTNKERFKNFAILVDGQRCASYRSNIAFTVKNFTCNAVGRELKIVNYDKFLTLCEVQAFGTMFANK